MEVALAAPMPRVRAFCRARLFSVAERDVAVTSDAEVNAWRRRYVLRSARHGRAGATRRSHACVAIRKCRVGSRQVEVCEVAGEGTAYKKSAAPPEGQQHASQ